MEKNKTVDYSKCSEKKICHLIGQEDEEAFSFLYERHHRELFSFIISKNSNPELADDICSIAWTKVWRRIGTFKNKSAVKTWIHRIALNALWDHKRREKKYLLVNDHVSDEFKYDLDQLFRTDSGFAKLVCPEYGIVEQPVVYDKINMKELFHYLKKSMRVLSKEHQEALGMWIFEEMGYKEIAERKNIPMGTVMSRIFYARQLLKKELAKRLKDALDECLPTKNLCPESK